MSAIKVNSPQQSTLWYRTVQNGSKSEPFCHWILKCFMDNNIKNNFCKYPQMRKKILHQVQNQISKNNGSRTKYPISSSFLYLLRIQTLSRVLVSGSLCKELQLVCISPASDSTMPEGNKPQEMWMWRYFESNGNNKNVLS